MAQLVYQLAAVLGFKPAPTAHQLPKMPYIPLG